MHHISNVEGIDDSRVLVSRRRASRVECVHVVIRRRALRSRTSGGRGLVCENIVTRGSARGRGSVLVPPVGRGGCVVRVGQRLEAISRILRGEGNDAVLCG